MEFIIIAFMLIIVLITILCYIFYRLNKLDRIVKHIIKQDPNNKLHLNRHDNSHWWRTSGYK